MEEEKKVSYIEIVTKFMRTLIDFEAQISRREFQTIFGKDKGLDLWIKFTQRCDNNTTIFYRILDEQEQVAFDKYIDRCLRMNDEKNKIKQL
jgi:hypothetical protein